MVQMLFDKDYFACNEQNITIEPRNPQPVYPEHTHNFNEIVIVTGGHGKHILNGHLFDLYPGMMFYIHASDCHLYENVDNLHLTNILFRDPDRFNFINGISDLIPQQDPFQAHYFFDKKCDHNIQTILTELNHSDTGSTAYQESLFLQLLILFKQNQYVETGTGANDNRVRQLLRWVQVHFKEDIDWSHVTQQFSLSLRSFHRHVKSEIGISPQKYLIKLRLADAYSQLIYTGKSVTTIAQECGFNDSAYFATCFKQEFNLTPQTLRNNPDKRYH